MEWRAWPGLQGPSSIEGAISGLPLSEIDTARIAIQGAGFRQVVPVRGGRFRLDGLPPGEYRIEIRLARLVLARRLELPLGHHFVTFAVHARGAGVRRMAA